MQLNTIYLFQFKFSLSVAQLSLAIDYLSYYPAVADMLPSSSSFTSMTSSTMYCSYFQPIRSLEKNLHTDRRTTDNRRQMTDNRRRTKKSDLHSKAALAKNLKVIISKINHGSHFGKNKTKLRFSKICFLDHFHFSLFVFG